MQRYLVILAVLLLIMACQPPQTEDISMDQSQATIAVNELMDNWHQAAAVADEETFFGSIRKDGIYLGTDKTERWEKHEFEDWSMEIFQRDTAWVFSPYDRELYFAEEGRTVWFEELLETWMGPCRGSGVLTLENGNWKIAHYNLAMLIDNADVQQVLKVIKVTATDRALPPLSQQDSL